MRRNIKVRGRDGAIRQVNFDYVLQDGEARVVELTLMDAHDGCGRPAGQRPGFLYSTNNQQAEQARAEAYTEYRDAIQQRWRGPQAPPSKPPLVFDCQEAAVAAAYMEYADTIQQRWRK